MVAGRRRKPGQGSIRKRANGTWEARITIDRVSRSYYGRTRREAVEQMESAVPDSARQPADSNANEAWFDKPAPFWPKGLTAEEFNRIIDAGPR